MCCCCVCGRNSLPAGECPPACLAAASPCRVWCMPRVFPAVLLPTGERLWLPVLLQGTAVPGLCLSLPSLSSGLFLGLGECEVASVKALKAFRAEEIVLLCELVGWEILCRVFGARVGKGDGWDGNGPCAGERALCWVLLLHCDPFPRPALIPSSTDLGSDGVCGHTSPGRECPSTAVAARPLRALPGVLAGIQSASAHNCSSVVPLRSQLAQKLL